MAKLVQVSTPQAGAALEPVLVPEPVLAPTPTVPPVLVPTPVPPLPVFVPAPAPLLVAAFSADPS